MNTRLLRTEATDFVGHRTIHRWHGRPVTCYRGRVNSLRRLLRRFKRRTGFRDHPHEITHRTIDQDREIVVGHVSPRYVLVQHEEVLDAVHPAVADQGWELENLAAELHVTGLGERMEMRINLPVPMATPPDGFPVACRLRCVNSVDGSTSVQASVQWYRQICSNGMFGWRTTATGRRIHRSRDILRWLRHHVSHALDEIPEDRLFFTELYETEVQPAILRDVVDVFVARLWGRRDAARAYHICLTGRDCVIDHDDRDLPAHRLTGRPFSHVPGACAPVRNLYHVGQALSWVAGQAESLEKRFARTREIPSLLRYLLPYTGSVAAPMP
jgi:hypothetical protein